MYQAIEPMERVEIVRALTGGKWITSTIHWDHLSMVLYARRQNEQMGEPEPARAA
jgi:hypothetical protein